MGKLSRTNKARAKVIGYTTVADPSSVAEHIHHETERAAREAKALARARRERERRKPLSHCPFAVALGR